MKWIFAALIAAAPLPGQAQIIICEIDGRTVYQNVPCNSPPSSAMKRPPPQESATDEDPGRPEPDRAKVVSGKDYVMQSDDAGIGIDPKVIERQFSAWDGSHIKLTRHIKKRLNDPDSYEHVETRYIEKDGHLLVYTTYRAKNGFGAKVLESIAAIVDKDGEVIEIF